MKLFNCLCFYLLLAYNSDRQCTNLANLVGILASQFTRCRNKLLFDLQFIGMMKVCDLPCAIDHHTFD